MTNKKRFLVFSLIVLSICLFDQITKKLIIEYFDINNSIIFITSFLNFDLIWNDGIAFGLLGFDNPGFYNLVTFIIGLVILVVFYFITISENHISYFYSMVAGGALGNFIDRIRFSAVPDFIDFHIGDFHWFVFNIADIFISLGVFCLIIAEIFYKKIKDEKI
ncbi:signal peptidase II [alpha proteobacterium HIMB5]|nr:signal peptidase II [alpha proteobacterium HIMB5]